MTKEELAKWLHDNYEAVAKEQNWDTQQSCKVEFDTLPDANKRTMIEIADRLLNFNLLRLHFVVGQSEQLLAFFQHIQREYNIEADVTFGEALKSFEGK
mgnify:CR=1 FL=1